MSTLSTTKVTPGSPMVSDNVNEPLTQVEAWANGNIDSTNIADGGITGVKLADSSVTSEKLLTTVAFSAFTSTGVSVGSTFTAVNPDTEHFDAGGNFDTVSGLFTAPYDGYYHIQGNAAVSSGITSRLLIQLTVSGTSLGNTARTQDYQVDTTASGPRARYADGSWMIHLTAGSTVGVQVLSLTTVTVSTTYSGYLVGRT